MKECLRYFAISGEGSDYFYDHLEQIFKPFFEFEDLQFSDLTETILYYFIARRGTREFFIFIREIIDKRIEKDADLQDLIRIARVFSMTDQDKTGFF